ncbi:protein of unknown function, partial [Pseudomonas inefficax]
MTMPNAGAPKSGVVLLDTRARTPDH